MSERIAIIGSRDFPELPLVEQYVRTLPAGTIVVSGAARGVDSVAAKAARECGLAVDEFPVTAEEWERIGKRAGHLRNERMIKTVDRTVGFWDGVSPGTEGALNFSRSLGKPTQTRYPSGWLVSAAEARGVVPELRRLYLQAKERGEEPSALFVKVARWLALGAPTE